MLSIFERLMDINNPKIVDKKRPTKENSMRKIQFALRKVHTTAEIADEVDLNKSTVISHLREMFNLGLVTRKRQKNNGKGYYWYNRGEGNDDKCE